MKWTMPHHEMDNAMNDTMWGAFAARISFGGTQTPTKGYAPNHILCDHIPFDWAPYDHTLSDHTLSDWTLCDRG